MRLLGSEVKGQREKYRYKLEKIAAKTKIRLEFLQAMEEGRFDYLPEFYVRNFFKLYLRHIGKNSQKFLDRYDDIMSYQQVKPVKTEKDKRKPLSEEDKQATNLRGRIIGLTSKHFSLIILGALSIAALLIFALRNHELEETRGIDTPEETVVVDDSSTLKSNSSFFMIPKDMQLELIAEEPTWLQLSIDDSATKEYLFKEKTRATWNAREKFLLRLGNAGGVKLMLDDKDLGKIGNSMQVKDLMITRSGMEEINR